jgi:putative ABC transport system permease protein
MRYIQQKDLSLTTDNVLAFPIWGIYDHAQQFTNELKQQTGIMDVTTSSLGLFDGANTTTDISWPGRQPDQKMWIAQFYVDKNFPNFFHTQFVQGKGFENTSPGADQYILNETAVRKMGLKNPVGQTVTFHDKTGIVIGIVKDFYFESFHTALAPVILQYKPDEAGYVYASIQQSNSKKVIAAAQRMWRKYEPILPMEYSYLDEKIASQYDSESRGSKLFDAFSIITLLISCLGLYGLVTHSSERRVKEIGIRKVLGADMRQIAALLSKEFILLILIAIGIAIPIVWVGMNKILENFAYRISLQWWVFVIACMGAVFIALVTVSFRAVKAAAANPVKSLRTE